MSLHLGSKNLLPVGQCHRARKTEIENRNFINIKTIKLNNNTAVHTKPMDKGIAGGTCYNLCTTNGMEVYQFIASVLYKNIELTFEKQK